MIARRDITLTLPNMAEAELDALEQALSRAAAAERSERVRANTLVTTGYGDRAGGDLREQGDRAGFRESLLAETLNALRAARRG